jgi:holo-[acyl-carrier protein] synthase
MILGVGVDIIEIERIEAALKVHGDRLRDRIFTAREVAYCEQSGRPAERYAVRFAAKEAARKALGSATPVRALPWHDVEIIASGEGAPHLELHGRARELASALSLARAHISLSHNRQQAIACVVLEGD